MGRVETEVRAAKMRWKARRRAGSSVGLTGSWDTQKRGQAWG